MIKQHLKDILKLISNDKQKAYYDWVLKNGKSFGKLKRIQNTKIIDCLKSINNKQIKQCFYNSQMIALSEDFDYYEGWYVTKGINLPFEHGWNVICNDVIDVTAYGKFDVNEYFGIKIPLEYIRNKILKTGYSDGFLSRYFYEEIYAKL